LGWAAVFFPAVGAGLGWAGYAVYAAGSLWWPREVAALLALAALAVLTGALHEDGLADVADAFGSQSTREGLERVMKDSRIGTYGAVALLLSYGVRWFCLSRLGLAGFLIGQTLPRAGIVAVAASAGPATSGSGGAFAAALGRGHVIAAWLTAAAFFYPVYQDPAMGWCVAGCLVLAGLASAYFKARLGGVTGDCLGATAIAMECLVLLILFAGSGRAA
jgi:adenosylcobinamide-GDP ribazoletransferase